MFMNLYTLRRGNSKHYSISWKDSLVNPLVLALAHKSRKKGGVLS